MAGDDEEVSMRNSVVLTCRVDLDAKGDEIKARPPAASNYNYVGDVLACPQCARDLLRRW